MVLKEREAAPDPVFKSEDCPFKNTVLREAALPPALKIELLELWQARPREAPLFKLVEVLLPL
jgi:hypothetical protein